jgi:hypothetical protein
MHGSGRQETTTLTTPSRPDLDQTHGSGRQDDPDAREEQQRAASPVPDFVELLRLVIKTPEEHAEA